MTKYWIIFPFIFLSVPINGICHGGNRSASQEVLSDLTSRIMSELRNFQDYVSLIAEGTAPEDIRKKGIEKCKLLFAPEATIEERNKYSDRRRYWEVDQYLWALFTRGERSPVLVDFEVIDKLNVDELDPIPQPDGSVIYRGTMIFKQYYCKLKPVESRQEITASNPNVNCAYDDITEKEVTVEIKRQTSVKGEFWITQFTQIKVLRVY